MATLGPLLPGCSLQVKFHVSVGQRDGAVVSVPGTVSGWVVLKKHALWEANPVLRRPAKAKLIPHIVVLRLYFYWVIN